MCQLTRLLCLPSTAWNKVFFIQRFVQIRSQNLISNLWCVETIETEVETNPLAELWFSTGRVAGNDTQTRYYKAQKKTTTLFTKKQTTAPRHKPLNSVSTEECYVCSCGWGWEFYRIEGNTTQRKASVFFHPPIQAEFIYCPSVKHCLYPHLGPDCVDRN